MQIEKAPDTRPKRQGHRWVHKLPRSEWGNIYDRWLTGDTLTNIAQHYDTGAAAVGFVLPKVYGRLRRGWKVMQGDQYATDHRPMQDELTPWIENKLSSLTTRQVEALLRKEPRFDGKPRRVK